MKTRTIITKITATAAFLSLATSSLAAAEAKDLKALLQQGLYEEEAAQQYEKAAENYSQLLTEYEAQRQLAATALFRLAEVRRKQNKPEEAAKLYQQLLAEFPTAEPLARLSRENLVSLGKKVEAGAPSVSQEIAALEKLAAESPDLLFRGTGGGSRLAAEAGKGNLAIVQFLLSKGAKDDSGSALQSAAGSGYKAICELLLEKGSPLDGGDGLALNASVKNGHLEVTKLFLEKGANPNLPKEGTRPLSAAIASGNDNLTELLLQHNVEVNYVCSTASTENEQDRRFSEPEFILGTPLEQALQLGNVSLAKKLLERKANPKVENAKSKLTPLHLAAKLNNLELCQQMLDLGCAPNVRTQKCSRTLGGFTAVCVGGESPLYFALDKGGTEMACAKLLLARGATFAGDDLAQFQAVLRGKSGVPLLLAEKELDLNPSLLTGAFSSRNIEAADLLLTAGAKPTGVVMTQFFYWLETGITPEQQQLLDLLIKHGGDPVGDLANPHFVSSRRLENHLKFSREYFYPALAATGNVTLAAPYLGKRWTLAQKGAGEPDSLTTLLITGMPSPGDWGYAPNYAPNNQDVYPKFSKVTLHRKGQEPVVVDLLSDAAFPALAWGDVLVPCLELPREDGLISPPSTNARNQNDAPWRQEILVRLAAQQTTEISVTMEGAPAKLTLSGKRLVYDPTDSTVPMANAQRLFQMLGGRHPQFTGATLKVHRQGWGDITAMEGTPSAAIDLQKGDSLEVIPQEDMKRLKITKNADGSFNVDPSPESMTDGAKKNYARQITVTSDVPFTHVFYSYNPPTVCQAIAEMYAPMCEKFLNETEVTDWTKALREQPRKSEFLQILPYPDFSNIQIIHPSVNKVTVVNLQAAMDNEALTSDEARKLDKLLASGEVVLIPTLQPKPTEPWAGLDAKTEAFLKKALTYRINLAQDGKTLQLRYEWSPPAFTQTPAGMVIYNPSRTPWLHPTIDALCGSVYPGSGSSGSYQRVGDDSKRTYVSDGESWDGFGGSPVPARRRKVVLPPQGQ